MNITINHIRIDSTCDFVSNKNHIYFHIIQLLEVYCNIIYTYHYFKFTIAIRPTARMCYLIH